MFVAEENQTALETEDHPEAILLDVLFDIALLDLGIQAPGLGGTISGTWQKQNEDIWRAEKFS